MIISGTPFKKSYYFAYSWHNKLKILSSNPYRYLKIVCPGFCFKKEIGILMFYANRKPVLKISETRGFKPSFHTLPQTGILTYTVIT
jgi:hypothetical protein